MRRLTLTILITCLTTLAFAAAKVSPPGRWTAREVQQYAFRKAYEWDKSFQLIMISARPFDFGTDGKSSRWSFRCISADGKSCASFSVDMAHPNTPTRITRNVKVPTQCEAQIYDYKWRIDSPEACAIAKRSGLDAWLAKHPTFASAYDGNRFELVANKNDGPYWLVSLAAKPLPSSRKYDRFELRISATTGRVLPKLTQ